MPTRLLPQVELQATLRTLDGTQTLKASCLLKRLIRITSDVNRVLLVASLDKSGLAKDQVGGGIALKKDCGRILNEAEERHPFCWLFVLNLEKPFNDGTQQKPVRVLVERHESCR